jgi:hypothetical protein
MKKNSLLVGLVVACATLIVPILGTNAGAQDTVAVLDSAESLFKMMKAKNYKNIWGCLSTGSKSVIASDTYKAVSKSGAASNSDVQYSKDSVAQDFESGGPLSKAYWDAYVDNFNPDMVLEESKWSMGDIKKGRAEIIIQYKKGESPVHLLMVMENGKWKVGLMETFAWAGR